MLQEVCLGHVLSFRTHYQEHVLQEVCLGHVLSFKTHYQEHVTGGVSRTCSII